MPTIPTIKMVAIMMVMIDTKMTIMMTAMAVITTSMLRMAARPVAVATPKRNQKLSAISL